MISREPGQFPELDQNAVVAARKAGLSPVCICCDEPDAKTGDSGSVQFWAFLSQVPQVGEHIELEDGTCCEVKDVTHIIVDAQAGELKFKSATANVYAVNTGIELSRRK